MQHVLVPAAGANVIPTDIFHSVRTRAGLSGMVRDARAAHINMLRLWGGGLPYFPDAFYARCDEAGILGWQESAFACALYPRDAPFLHEVGQHACHVLVLYCQQYTIIESSLCLIHMLDVRVCCFADGLAYQHFGRGIAGTACCLANLHCSAYTRPSAVPLLVASCSYHACFSSFVMRERERER